MNIKPISKTWVLLSLIVAVALADTATVALRAGGRADTEQKVTRSAMTYRAPSGSARSGKSGGTARGNASTGAGSRGTAVSPGAQMTAGLGFPLPPDPVQLRYQTHTKTTTSATGTQERTDYSTYGFGQAIRQGNAFLQTVAIVQGSRTVRRTNRWDAGGITRLTDATEANGKTTTCTYDPPRLVVQFPLKINAAWSLPVEKCKEATQSDYTMSGTETDTVARTETVVVGGHKVFCYVIKSVSKTSYSGPQGTGTGTKTELQWFSPDYRLFVKTQTHVDATFKGTPPNPTLTETQDALTILLALPK